MTCPNNPPKEKAPSDSPDHHPLLSDDWSVTASNIHHWALHTMGCTGPGLAVASAQPVSLSQLNGKGNDSWDEKTPSHGKEDGIRAVMCGKTREEDLANSPTAQSLQVIRTKEALEVVEKGRRAWEDRLAHSQRALQRAQEQRNRVLHKVKQISTQAVKDRARARQLNTLSRRLQVLLTHYQDRRSRVSKKDGAGRIPSLIHLLDSSIEAFLNSLPCLDAMTSISGHASKALTQDDLQDALDEVGPGDLLICLGRTMKRTVLSLQGMQKDIFSPTPLIHSVNMYQSALQTVHCQSTLVKEKEEEEKWLINHGIRENDSIGSEEEQRKRIIRKLVQYRQLLAEDEAEDEALAFLHSSHLQWTAGLGDPRPLELRVSEEMDDLKSCQSRVDHMNEEIKSTWANLQSLAHQAEKRKREEAIPLTRWIEEKGTWSKEGGMSELEETYLGLSSLSPHASSPFSSHRRSLLHEDLSRETESFQSSPLGPGTREPHAQAPSTQGRQGEVLQAHVDRIIKEMITSYSCAFHEALKGILARAEEARSLVRETQMFLQQRHRDELFSGPTRLEKEQG
ncbi:MAG: hypothetical protein DHS80DRAFT_25437 [Piptocephalis tieghemiana]|nr:MAG: hypothetical protein DHS80DRAFT_25437 [Piptocephalis tieghemiana]